MSERLPAVNSEGVPHLHIVGLPEAEASELKSQVEGMRAKNTDHESAPVFNPSVSGAQHRAMEAAAHGHSTLGIPAKVGRDFVRADAKKR